MNPLRGKVFIDECRCQDPKERVAVTRYIQALEAAAGAEAAAAAKGAWLRG